MSCPFCQTNQTECQDVPRDKIFGPTGALRIAGYETPVWSFDCNVCGRFVITKFDLSTLADRFSADSVDRMRIAALLCERRVRRLPTPWLRCRRHESELDTHGEYPAISNSVDTVVLYIDELLDQWPRSLIEKLNRALSNLARECKRPGTPIALDPNNIAFLFGESHEEALQFHLWLRERGDLTADSSIPRTDLSLAGWTRFEEFERARSSLDRPAFVAMWFGGEEKEREMDQLFVDGIKEGCRRAGYNAIRVDLTHHNDGVLDKIIGDIKVAPFVVADFTEHRNGVYFEAGFARGLGTPVIHTCRKDAFPKSHFDIQGLNCIQWENPQQLADRLCDRIRATIGEGPYAETTAILQ